MTTEQELATLRTELAKVTKERDEARACVKTMCNAGGFSEPHQGPDEYTNEIEDRAEALRGNIRYWKAATDERDAALAKLESIKQLAAAEIEAFKAEAEQDQAQLAAAHADSAASLNLWREIITKARDAWIKNAKNDSPVTLFAAMLTGIDAAIDSAKEGK